MEWHKTGGTGALMIADIDKMKTINDKFGHASGDIALRTVASVLKDQLPKDWIICRFGGDEFFVGGKLLDGMDLEEMKDAITLKLASEVKRMQVPFKLTISIGYARIDPDGSIDLESQLRLADQFMYIVKEQHHQLLESQQ